MTVALPTVYDACLVAYANGPLIGRRSGNLLDRRLRVLEDFITGARVARYNHKLLVEYQDHVTTFRNDVIEAFLRRLADRGTKVERNTLSRQNFAKARRARWPAHDQHLLAAALGARRGRIATTERTLGICGPRIKELFEIGLELVT